MSLANADLVQFKATIIALRDELQDWPLRRDDAVRLALAPQFDEIRQLKDTIAALRNTLELAQVAKEDAVSAARTQDHAEIMQLKATIQALRDQWQATLTPQTKVAP